jgi:hypothetical protein
LGFQALIVPSSVAKMNRARPELPFSVTVKGDAAIVRFLAAAEILESDLWE